MPAVDSQVGGKVRVKALMRVTSAPLRLALTSAQTGQLNRQRTSQKNRCVSVVLLAGSRLESVSAVFEGRRD